MASAFLSIEGITKTYGNFVALRDLHVTIEKREFVCLLGPKGCGNTTLLRIIAGLEQPASGRIVVDDIEITSLPAAKRNFGMMFQSHALFPNLTAAQNIAYGIKEKLSRKECKEKVQEVMEIVDVSRVADRYPAQLSGGQRQRVALARAIALSPDLLLLEEPLSTLDAKVRHKLRRKIRSLHEKLGITTVMVTHDQEEALTMADKIVVMNKAEVVQVGSPQDLYEKPSTPFVADFIGAINFFDGVPFPEHCDQEGTLLAIRPEHMQVLEEDSEVGIQAVVRNIEYRGPFYRVLLQMMDERKMLLDRFVTLNLSVPLSRRINLKMNKTISLELPTDRLISFDRPATAK